MTNTKILLTTLLSGLGCLSSQMASAENQWTIAAGVMVEQSPYRAYDNIILPIPVLYYEGERFFIKTLDLGAHLIKTETHWLDINVCYGSIDFKPSKSDDSALRQLDKRKNPIFAGLSYQLNTEFGNFRTEVAVDMLGNSKGFVADLNYQYPIQLGRFSLTPGIGHNLKARNITIIILVSVKKKPPTAAFADIIQVAVYRHTSRYRPPTVSAISDRDFCSVATPD